MITSWLRLKQRPTIVIFHQLGSGAHGSRPRGTPSSGDGTGSGEGPSANGVQRTARSLCTDHYGHVEFRPTARSQTEPQRGWETLAAAVRWKPARLQ